MVISRTMYVPGVNLMIPEANHFAHPSEARLSRLSGFYPDRTYYWRNILYLDKNVWASLLPRPSLPFIHTTIIRQIKYKNIVCIYAFSLCITTDDECTRAKRFAWHTLHKLHVINPSFFLLIYTIHIKSIVFVENP